MKLLLRDALVRAGPPFADAVRADVAIADGRIQAVLPAGRGDGADRVIDLDGALLVPGFVDAHTHLGWAGHELGKRITRLLVTEPLVLTGLLPLALTARRQHVRGRRTVPAVPSLPGNVHNHLGTEKVDNGRWESGVSRRCTSPRDGSDSG